MVQREFCSVKGGQHHLHGMHTPVRLTSASSQIHSVNIIPLPKGWVPQQILCQHKCALPHYQAHMLKMLFTFDICAVLRH